VNSVASWRSRRCHQAEGTIRQLRPPPCGDRDKPERDGNVLKADLIVLARTAHQGERGGFCRQTTRNAECYTAAESYWSTTINAGRSDVQAHQDPMGGGDGGGLSGCPLRCAKSIA
jgi:hypothetical protein